MLWARDTYSGNLPERTRTLVKGGDVARRVKALIICSGWFGVSELKLYIAAVTSE